MVAAPDVLDGRAGGCAFPDIGPRRHHRPAGDFRTSLDSQSIGDPHLETHSVRTHTVRWPRFECATARCAPARREADCAPWNKGDVPSGGWKTSRFAQPSNGAAGMCSGVELGDTAVSGEAPDWMHLWAVPKGKETRDSWERDPLQQCTQKQFRPKMDGAAGKNTGVALDDSAISKSRCMRTRRQQLLSAVHQAGMRLHGCW